MSSHQLVLNNALASWQQWPLENTGPPKVAAVLQGGHTNHSYKIRSGQHSLVLRINSPYSLRLGIDRKAEKVILDALGKKEISPRLVFCCENFTFSVLEFIEGKVWRTCDLQNAKRRRQLADRIVEYQNISLSLPQFNYSAYLRRYWQRYQRKNTSDANKHRAQWNRFIKRLQIYEKTRNARTLSHHDLNPSNIIEGPSGLRIIDWEYAGMGFAELDYAAIANTGKKIKRQQVGTPEIIIDLLYWLDFLWWKIR